MKHTRRHDVRSLESLPASSEAAVIKHVLSRWVQSPVVSFSWPTWLSWNLIGININGELVMYFDWSIISISVSS